MLLCCSEVAAQSRPEFFGISLRSVRQDVLGFEQPRDAGKQFLLVGAVAQTVRLLSIHGRGARADPPCRAYRKATDLMELIGSLHLR